METEKQSPKQSDQPTLATCQGLDCGDSFVWVVCIKRNGKEGRVPLNKGRISLKNRLDPAELKGKFVFIVDLDGDGDRLIRGAVAGDLGPFYESHFSTCPNADEFRGGK